MGMRLDRGSVSCPHGYCWMLVASALAVAATGCEVTPSTGGMLCVRYHETSEPVVDASVALLEGAMFKPGRASDEGTTGADGCVKLKAGLLKNLQLFIETAEGVHYFGNIAHPRVDPARSRLVLPSTITPGARVLSVELTEVK
jgi:hypothetical protein